ncbi:MAG TPA: hypothetical protein PLT51_02235 [Candidatus Dojkabacteria bacterium]|mgnify:CR=1|jgi:hypothetical protein|nr:hypothetical protein [Candidatus Dojkabacteria bacterium]
MLKNHRHTISDTYRTFPKRKIVERKKYFKVLSEFFYEVSLIIIRKKYVYKLPFGLGKIFVKPSGYNKQSLKRLKRNRTGSTLPIVPYKDTLATDFKFWSFRWHRCEYSSLGVMRYYDFEPNRGTVDRKIGKIGLKNWILKCAYDPNLKDYYES